MALNSRLLLQEAHKLSPYQKGSIKQWIIICTIKVQDMVLEDENSWDVNLASNLFEWHAIVHTTMHYTSAQFVFGQYSILNTCHKANWQLIQKCKQDLINQGDRQKNLNCKEHICNKWDKVLLKNAWKNFNQHVYLSPYSIKAVNIDNMTRKIVKEYEKLIYGTVKEWNLP